MLDGDILVSHRFRLVLRVDQDFVEVLSQVDLSASRYLRKLRKGCLSLIRELLAGDSHLRDQFQNQAVI